MVLTIAIWQEAGVGGEMKVATYKLAPYRPSITLISLRPFHSL